MIPLRDSQPIRRFPLVNWLLIATNVLVFLFEVSLGSDTLNLFIQRFGLVPVRLIDNIPAYWITIFSSMFLHGSWLHLISNMLALYIFGDNIEDRLGSARYLLFYFLGGAAAAAIHILSNPASSLPTVGASGAIAAVLGAYLILYPRARVATLVPIFFFIQIVQIPAVLYLGFWFFSQLLNGTAQIAANTFQSGGVAWWAHIGGFIAGILLILLFSPPTKPKKRTVWEYPEIIVTPAEKNRSEWRSSNRYRSGWE